MLSPLRNFLATEAAGALLLAAGALTALVWANSPIANSYESFWTNRAALSVAGQTLDLDIRHWLNEGLMAIFFLVVGLEIKRELTSGHLSTRRAALLPGIAALAGMVAPALVYLAIAGGTSPRGWAIPMATDIALAVGALTVAGSRVPPSLRAFLLGLAIVDDIGAIVIIAVVYSAGLAMSWLAAAVVTVMLTVVIRRVGVRFLWPYAASGVALWLCLQQAGIHPTIAGVALGLLIPGATVERLENLMHPLSGFVIVPLFALANSGVRISTAALQDAAGSPIAWGVFAGLVIGKPLGIVLATRVSVGARVAETPVDSNQSQLVGIGTAAGIGFTVALFITELALPNPQDQAVAKLAILLASALAAAMSISILMRGPRTTD
jgi:Na+:H+ antiporter, NhaA family